MPRVVTHVCNKEAEIAVMKTNLENQTVMIQEIHHRLVGNGQPGVIADIKELKSMKEDFKEARKNIDDINKRMWTFAGVVAVITFLLSILVPKLVSALHVG